MKRSKCFLKFLEVIVYLVVGFFLGGCSNTGTFVLHANVMNAIDPISNISTNNPSIKE